MVEEQFVFAKKAQADQPAQPQSPSPQAAESRHAKRQVPVARTHFTTRLRTDFATAVKRASLERQLGSQFPNTVQEILEEALEPWLRRNGYLK